MLYMSWGFIIPAKNSSGEIRILGNSVLNGILRNFTEFRILIAAELRNFVKFRRNSVVRNSAGRSDTFTGELNIFYAQIKLNTESTLHQI